MDPTSNHDPFRALDGHEPPPDWDGVLARAAGPAVAAPPAPEHASASPRRRVLAVAAALLVIAGAAAGAAALRGDADRSDVKTGPSGQLGDDDSSAIWGRRWQVARIVHDGEHPIVVPAADAPIRLDLREPGTIEVNGCNQRTYQGVTVVEGHRTSDRESVAVGHLAVGVGTSTDGACVAGDGGADHLGRQDDLIDRILESKPEVQLQGDDLGLVTPDADRIELVDASAYDPPKAMEKREWRITELVIDGARRDVAGAGRPLVFGVGHGDIGYSGCNHYDSGAEVRGEVLEVGASWGSTLAACNPNLDPDVTAFLSSRPVVVLRDDRLVLSRGTSRLVAGPLEDDETTSTVPTTTAVPATTTTTDPQTATTTTEPEAVTTTTTIHEPMDDIPDELYIGPFWDQAELHVTWLTDGGVEPPFAPMTTMDTRGGAVRVAGCNGAGGPMKAEDRGPEGWFLVKDGDWPATRKACLGEDGKLLMDRDAWFDAFLRSEPKLTWDGDAEFTLTSGDQVVKFVWGGI